MITSVHSRFATSARNWSQVLAEVQADDKLRVDFDTTFRDLTVLPNKGRLDPNMTVVNEAGVESMTMTERAYRQYLTKLDIQHRQATLFSGSLQGQMIQERLDFRDPDTENPLVDPDAEIFLRTRTNPNRVRAILSGRYGNMRDAAVAEIVDRFMPQLDDYKVVRGRVMDHVFSVTLMGEKPVFTNGDMYFPVHVIQNSEVGASSFRVSSGVCKGACSNGMIFSHRKDCEYRIRHLGVNMQDRVVEALNASLGNVSTWGATISPAISRAKAQQIDLGDEKQLNRAVRQLRDRGLSKKLAVEVLNFSKVLPEETYGTEFLTGADNLVTQWHVINSLTHLAQSEGRFDEIERLDLEGVAGRLLMPKAA